MCISSGRRKKSDGHPNLNSLSPFNIPQYPRHHRIISPSRQPWLLRLHLPHPHIYIMAFRASRTLLSLRTIVAPRAIPASRTFTAAVRPIPSCRPVSLGYRYKSTERSAWAREPIISYEELKPITQQPNDVSNFLYGSAGQ